MLLAVLALLPFSPAQAAGKKHAPTASSHRTTAKAAKAPPARASAQRKSVAKASHRSPRVSAKLGGRHGKARVASKSNRLSLRHTAREEAPPRLSFGQMAGLHEVTGPLGLKSSVALVVDQDTHQVLLGKNEHAVLPIASLTKLMTGMVVSEAHLPMNELITITDEDVDTEKNSRSRLTVGTELSRGELLHLALMSSENRAAHALGRTFPGGLQHFVSLMNARARQLGMKDTRYVEPTGLSSANQSSAQDLALLVGAAYQNPQLRELTTSPSHEVAVGHRTLEFRNTNGLVKSPEWDIGLQKTGYISEAGRCLVMQARIAGRKLIMVFLDSAGKYSRIADAERVRRWVEMLPHASTVAGHGFAG
ncbi:MAG: serine hydrolase [Burkholderiaceae bacterium]